MQLLNKLRGMNEAELYSALNKLHGMTIADADDALLAAKEHRENCGQRAARGELRLVTPNYKHTNSTLKYIIALTNRVPFLSQTKRSPFILLNSNNEGSQMKDLKIYVSEQAKQFEELRGRAKKFFDEVMPQIRKLCIQDYQNLNELGIILNQIDAQPKINPMFSDDLGDFPHDDSQYEALAGWQTARARIIEKINIANKGDNGFKAGKDNYYICLAHEYGNARSELCIYDIGRAQSIEPMLYTRTYKAAQELLKDPEFCEDVKTYFKGWL